MESNKKKQAANYEMEDSEWKRKPHRVSRRAGRRTQRKSGGGDWKSPLGMLFLPCLIRSHNCTLTAFILNIPSPNTAFGSHQAKRPASANKFSLSVSWEQIEHSKKDTKAPIKRKTVF